MNPEVVTVGDLRNNTKEHTFLYCNECQGEYSSHAGDYFLYKESYTLTCCEQPLSLVIKEVRLIKVKP